MKNYVNSFIFDETLFFKNSFGFRENLTGKCRRFPYISCPHTYAWPSPLSTSPPEYFDIYIFVTADEPTLTCHNRPKFLF